MIVIKIFHIPILFSCLCSIGDEQSRFSCMNPAHEILLSDCKLPCPSDLQDTRPHPQHLCLDWWWPQKTVETDLTIFQTRVWSRAINTHFVSLLSVKVIVDVNPSGIQQRCPSLSHSLIHDGQKILLIFRLFMFKLLNFLFASRQSVFL